ncbi:hypothetical protein K32_49350 [Kaistia sp. 32K]|nr:hypothetical protein K32_49350 [Kaistia sp. 32K]
MALCATRRTPFDANMHKVAKRNAKERAKTTEFWFRRKYNLTSTDPRFLDATLEEMITDYWAHTFLDDPKALEEIEDEDFDMDAELAKMEAGHWETIR